MAEGPRFQTITEYDLEEYRGLLREVSRHHRVSWAVSFVMPAVLLLLAVLFWSRGHRAESVVMLVFMLLFVVVYLALRSRNEKKLYDSNKALHGLRSRIMFFEDRMRTESRLGVTNVKYDDIYAIYETETNYYIMTAPAQGTIVVKKNSSAELEDFLTKLAKAVSEKSRDAR